MKYHSSMSAILINKYDHHTCNSGLRFDVMNKLNAHGGLFVGQKAAAAAGAHM